MGHAILKGKIPFKDDSGLWSTHLFLFPYLLSLSYILFANIYFAPVILFILFDFGTLLLVQRVFDKRLALLYTVLPISWFVTVFLYQEEVILSFFLLLTYYFIKNNKELHSSLSFTLGGLLTKVHFLLFGFPIFLLLTRRAKIAAIMIFILINVFFLLIGSNPYKFLLKEFGNKSGPNIWLLLERFGINIRIISRMTFLLTLISSIFLILWMRGNVFSDITFLGIAYMLFGFKTGITYLAIFFPFMLKWIVDRKLLNTFFIYNLMTPISYIFASQQLIKPHHILLTLTERFPIVKYIIPYTLPLGVLVVGSMIVFHFFYFLLLVTQRLRSFKFKKIEKRISAPLIIFFLSILLQIPLYNYEQDDTYVITRVAQNIANGYCYSLNPGECAYANTSVLPPLIVSIFVIISNDYGLILQKLMTAIFTAMVPVTAYIVARSKKLPIKSSFLISLLFVLNPWLIRFGFSGMETGIFVFFLLFTLYTLDKNPVIGGFLLGLTYLVRPEVVLTVPILLILSIDEMEYRKVLITFLLTVLPWLIYSQLSLGSLKPTALRTKVHFSKTNLAFFLLEFFTFLPFVCEYVFLTKKGSEKLLLLWSFLTIGYYLILGTGTPRYLVGFTTIPLLLGSIYAFSSKRVKKYYLLYLTKSILLLIFIYFIYSQYTVEFRNIHFRAAKWIKNNTPENTRVFTNFPGTIAYISDREVIGFHPGVVEARKYKDIVSFVVNERPQYLFLSGDDEEKLFADLNEECFEKIFSGNYTMFSLSRWNVRFTLYKARCYELKYA